MTQAREAPTNPLLPTTLLAGRRAAWARIRVNAMSVAACSASEALAASGVSVRVTSLNVLSSAYSSPATHVHCDPENLFPPTRLDRTRHILSDEIGAHRPVLALQEVSLPWLAQLLPFFAEKQYAVVPANYGDQRSGYMGVALAYPTDRFELVAADVARIADTRRWPRPSMDASGSARPPAEAPAAPAALAEVAAPAEKKEGEEEPEPSSLELLWSNAQQRASRSATAVSRYFKSLWRAASDPFVEREPEDFLSLSKRRFNQAIALRLRGRGTAESAASREFVVATYHMPCVWYAPKVMATHAALTAQWVQRFASAGSACPYVLMGDFNIKPSSPMYRMLIEGTLPEDAVDMVDYHFGPNPGLRPEPAFPEALWGDTWRPRFSPMRSAYAEAAAAADPSSPALLPLDGAASARLEPEFTNMSQMEGDLTMFVATLDYVFLSPEWRIDGVLPLPKLSDLPLEQRPLPNAQFPSDHIMIAASIALPPATAEAAPTSQA